MTTSRPSSRLTVSAILCSSKVVTIFAIVRLTLRTLAENRDRAVGHQLFTVWSRFLQIPGESDPKLSMFIYFASARRSIRSCTFYTFDYSEKLPAMPKWLQDQWLAENSIHSFSHATFFTLVNKRLR